MTPKHNITATELGLHIRDEQSLFEWFLASFFFGKPIQQSVAERTFLVFQKHGLTSPTAIQRKSWQELIDILREGHYVRYDESTARYLLSWSKVLLDEYDGKLSNVKRRSSSKAEFERRLQEFVGVGPKTVAIFMREADEYLFRRKA